MSSTSEAKDLDQTLVAQGPHPICAVCQRIVTGQEVREIIDRLTTDPDVPIGHAECLGIPTQKR